MVCIIDCQGCFLVMVSFAWGKQGLSSHSTILSGLLAFIITYASPFLFLIGMMLLSSPPPSTDRLQISQGIGFSETWLLETLAVPCILPMALNGVILVAFTAVLTLMQDHLFVWSVFSPKYEVLLLLYLFSNLIPILCSVFLIVWDLILGVFAGIYMFVQQQPVHVLVHCSML